MAVIQERYETSSPWTFWSNRYLRLMPSYLLIMATTVGLAIAFPETALPFVNFEAPNVFAAVLLLMTNLSLFGADLIELFNTKWSQGLIVPQGWSLGAELWFYLLVPLFWRLKNRTLWFVAGASLATRLLLVAADVPFFPWQQRFFPAELMFFLVGMLAYRCRTNLVVSPRATPLATYAVVLCFGWLTTRYAWFASVLLAALLFVTLPTLWQHTGKSAWDRLVGELSYPVYLAHIAIGYLFSPAQSIGNGLLLLALTIVVAIPLVLFVEQPLDRWRAGRITAPPFPGNSPRPSAR